jgi:hypothetical protein
MKIDNLVICGDSFHVGIGCHDLINEPYGSLLSKKYNSKLYNFARGSSSNFAVYLQVKYALENIKNIDFMCIGVTSYDRTEWFSETTKEKQYDVSLRDVNYHQYPPYGSGTYPYLLDNPMKDDPKYKGEMLVENYRGIIHYHESIKEIKRIGYYSKFTHEPDEKMALLYKYYFEIFDIGIKRLYDVGLITMTHNLLKNRNIPHLILTHDEEFKNYIPNENLINIDWGPLTIKYPDDLKTLHTSYEGHIEVFNQIVDKIDKKII